MLKKSRIPLQEIHFEFTRSRGPGGQHVNKTETAVILRWWPAFSESLTDWQKQRILQKLEGQLTNEGELVLRSDEFREREQNKSRCLEKLGLLVEQALHVPKVRHKTKPTKSSQRRRVDQKIKRGDIKSSRKKVQWE